MCPSNYYRFWDTAKLSEIFVKISSFYHTPLHSTPPLGGFPSEYRHPLWDDKLKWCRYPTVKKFRRYLYSFWRDPRTSRNVTDGRTDGQTLHDNKDRACIASRGKNGSCPMHEWDHPPIFWDFNSPPSAPQRPMDPTGGNGHVGRHCSYTNKIRCGSVHALLRYRSKTAKNAKIPHWLP